MSAHAYLPVGDEYRVGQFIFVELDVGLGVDLRGWSGIG
jgi:hypothetical protein